VAEEEGDRWGSADPALPGGTRVVNHEPPGTPRLHHRTRDVTSLDEIEQLPSRAAARQEFVAAYLDAEVRTITRENFTDFLTG